jgi:putative toxin-antitoxin system antitoxin component (TIGR02293 family)
LRIIYCKYTPFDMKEYKQVTIDKDAILQEPAVGYATGSFYQLSVQNISKNYIKQVLILSRLTVSELINIVPISIDTYKRKSDFNPAVTEKILEIEEVYRKGLEAFGESFHQWMNTENIALGSVTPKTLLKNSFGIRLLLDEIGRLEYGVLA